MGEGPDSGAVTDLGRHRHRVGHDRPLPHDGVDEAGVGTDLAAAADDGVPLEDRPREQRHVGAEADAGVDVGALGVDHGDTLDEPPGVRAAAQLGLSGGELGPVVDAHKLGRVVDDDGTDGVAGGGQHRHDVGEVVLALGVVGRDAPEGGGDDTAPEAVDRHRHLVDGPLLRVGVDLLHDPGDPA